MVKTVYAAGSSNQRYVRLDEGSPGFCRCQQERASQSFHALAQAAQAVVARLVLGPARQADAVIGYAQDDFFWLEGQVHFNVLSLGVFFHVRQSRLSHPAFYHFLYGHFRLTCPRCSLSGPSFGDILLFCWYKHTSSPQWSSFRHAFHPRRLREILFANALN